ARPRDGESSDVGGDLMNAPVKAELVNAPVGGALTAAPANLGSVDDHPGRWRMLALLASAELLGMSLWFAGSAVASQLVSQWGGTGGEAAWLTTIVQLGFVAGTATAALLNLADILPSRWYFAIAALIAAVANASLVGSAGFGSALTARFVTGFCLAGVY